MHDVETLLSQWLASQDPFVQVGLGIAFILILVPLLMAGVALIVTRLEIWLENAIAALPQWRAKLAVYPSGKGWLRTGFFAPQATPVARREPTDVVVAWRHAQPPNRK